MFGSMGGYQRMRQGMEKAKTAPSRKVTRDEFIAAMLAAGETPEKAEFHAKIAEGMGAGVGVMVGKEMLEIRPKGK